MNAVMPVSVKTGDVAPASMELSDCAELDSENKKARDELTKNLESKQNVGKLNEEEQKVLNKVCGTGMTFSSASSKVPNATGSYTACSSGMARAKVPDQVCEGGTGAQKMGLNKTIRLSDDHAHDGAKEAAGVLCDKSHIHPGGGAGAHAEPKIFNELTNLVGAENMRGGSMLFSIDWRSATHGQSGMPCSHCFNMLCHAAKKCDIRIFICSHDNKPVELSKNDCEDEDAYEKLCRAVDGGSKPGRKK